MVSLGQGIAGAFTPSDELAAKIATASSETGASAGWISRPCNLVLQLGRRTASAVAREASRTTRLLSGPPCKQDQEGSH